MRTHLVTGLLVMAAFGAVVLPAAAGTIRVPKDFATIQGAVDAAGDGDVVLIRKGVYEEHVLIDGKTDLVIRAGRGVVIAAGDDGHGIEILDSELVQVTGLEIRRAINGVRIESCTRVTITKCLVHNTSAEGLRADDSAFLAITKNRFESTGSDGIALAVSNSEATVDDSLVSGNRFTDAGDDAIDLHGARNVVERNIVISTAEDGIEIDSDERGSDNVFVKNRISGVPGRGIALHGDDNVCVGNRITEPGDDAIVVDGTGNEVSRNKIKRPAFDGVFLSGAGNTIDRNKITAPGDDGVDDDAGSQKITKNRVTKAVGHGFEIGGSGNVLTKNVAKGSGGFDVADTAAADSNLYVKNKFKTQSIPSSPLKR